MFCSLRSSAEMLCHFRPAQDLLRGQNTVTVSQKRREKFLTMVLTARTEKHRLSGSKQKQKIFRLISQHCLGLIKNIYL